MKESVNGRPTEKKPSSGRQTEFIHHRLPSLFCVHSTRLIPLDSSVYPSHSRMQNILNYTQWDKNASDFYSVVWWVKNREHSKERIAIPSTDQPIICPLINPQTTDTAPLTRERPTRALLHTMPHTGEKLLQTH